MQQSILSSIQSQQNHQQARDEAHRRSDDLMRSMIQQLIQLQQTSAVTLSSIDQKLGRRQRGIVRPGPSTSPARPGPQPTPPPTQPSASSSSSSQPGNTAGGDSGPPQTNNEYSPDQVRAQRDKIAQEQARVAAPLANMFAEIASNALAGTETASAYVCEGHRAQQRNTVPVHFGKRVAERPLSEIEATTDEIHSSSEAANDAPTDEGTSSTPPQDLTSPEMVQCTSASVATSFRLTPARSSPSSPTRGRTARPGGRAGSGAPPSGGSAEYWGPHDAQRSNRG